jgi:hypothetical protein
MKTITAILLMLFTCAVQAQETITVIKSNSFQLDFSMMQIKEENLHPKVHHGLLYGLQYGHSRQKINISTFRMGLGFSRLKTNYEPLSASASVRLRGTYHYLFKIANSDKVTFHMGPEINLAYALSYFPNWDESHLYWANSLDLGIRNKFSYHINVRQTLALDLGFSLFSVFSRPELDRQYKIDDISLAGILGNMNSNPEGGTMNKSLLLSFQAEYQFHTGERITQAICYSYNYNRVKSNDGFPFQDNLHKLGFKIYF